MRSHVYSRYFQDYLLQPLVLDALLYHRRPPGCSDEWLELHADHGGGNLVLPTVPSYEVRRENFREVEHLPVRAALLNGRGLEIRLTPEHRKN